MCLSDKVCKVVMACGIIHNWLLQLGDEALERSLDILDSFEERPGTFEAFLTPIIFINNTLTKQDKIEYCIKQFMVLQLLYIYRSASDRFDI